MDFDGIGDLLVGVGRRQQVLLHCGIFEDVMQYELVFTTIGVFSPHAPFVAGRPPLRSSTIGSDLAQVRFSLPRHFIAELHGGHAPSGILKKHFAQGYWAGTLPCHPEWRASARGGSGAHAREPRLVPLPRPF
jgi:hypothetical protein